MKKIIFLLFVFSLLAVSSSPLLAEQTNELTNEATPENQQKKRMEQAQLIAKITALGKKIKAKNEGVQKTWQPTEEFKVLVSTLKDQLQKQAQLNVSIYKKHGRLLKPSNQLQVKLDLKSKEEKDIFTITPLENKKASYSMPSLLTGLVKSFMKDPQGIAKNFVQEAHRLGFKQDEKMSGVTQKWLIKPKITFPGVKRIYLYTNYKNQISVVELRTTEGTLFYDFNQVMKVDQ